MKFFVKDCIFYDSYSIGKNISRFLLEPAFFSFATWALFSLFWRGRLAWLLGKSAHNQVQLLNLLRQNPISKKD